MFSVTLSRFVKSDRAFTYTDGYKACLSNSADNCHPISTYMEYLIKQMNRLPDEPTGWSFAEWRKGTNVAANLVAAHALMLEYSLPREDTEIVTRLHEKATKLGWAFFMIDTESKRGNTITVVFPLTSGINQAQYARLASIMAEELDEYGMEHGCLAATHIVQVHRSTLSFVVPGNAFDPMNELKRTAKMYQQLRALKYEGTRPRGKPVTQSDDAPQAIEDGLFCWFETPAEKRQREALEIMAQYGFTS